MYAINKKVGELGRFPLETIVKYFVVVLE